MSTIENIILNNLLFDDSFARKVLPFVKDEYFRERHDKDIFNKIKSFYDSYNAAPSKEALLIEVEKDKSIGEGSVKHIQEFLSSSNREEVNEEWLTKATEEFCQDSAVYNAIMESISIIDDENTKYNKTAIPDILSEALSVSFDNNVGHDFIDDAESRFEFYHRKEERVPFDIEMLNTVTKGGFPRKSLSVWLAGCVTPDTKVRIKCTDVKRGNKTGKRTFIIKNTVIAEIKTLLDNGHDVEIDSPDGFVKVNFFINKGLHTKYVLFDEYRNSIVECNADHLFETSIGWVSAAEIERTNAEINILTSSCKFKKFTVTKTDDIAAIVDLNIEHKNQRYYSNGVSSHNTGVGKTLVMCHQAANNMLDGKNVLYITLEMAAERISERIDSNLLDVPINELETLSKKAFMTKIGKLQAKTMGKLIVKEYPTASVNASHFKHLLNELALKRNFVPDIIYIDYLNLCLSSRIKAGSSSDSYSYVKSIAEELRGLAVENNVAMVSATQLNRSGYTNSDPGLEDTSESFGLPATVDFMAALITSDELEDLGQLMVKQLKNRYNEKAIKRFVMGIDRQKMRLYNVDYQSESEANDDKPVMNSTNFGSRQSEEDSMQFMTKKAGRRDFSNLF